MAIPQIPDWRERILMGVGVKPTSENLRFMDAWAKAEGGNASNNPFNTTQPMDSATSYNSVGVRNYLSPQQGIDATVNTLTNGRYGNIIGALRQGDDAMKTAAALSASPWGTGALTTKVLGGDPSPIASTPTAGVTGSQASQLREQMQLPQLGAMSDASDRQQKPQLPNLAESLQIGSPSPTAVRMMADLGKASELISKSRSNPTTLGTYGMDQENMPVARTLKTLQTGSTDSNFQTIDLGQDFDGPIHPNANPIVNMAQQFLGTPYLWGGADPRKGFDCSGFVQYLYAQAGVSVGRTTYDQVKQGQHINSLDALQAGDVVFFQSGGDVHHEGLYIGGGQFMHAPHTGDVVKISSLSEPYYASQFMGGRRFITVGDSPQPT